MVKPGPDGQKTYERGFPVGQKESVSGRKMLTLHIALGSEGVQGTGYKSIDGQAWLWTSLTS